MKQAIQEILEIGTTCFESYPCQHRCTFVDANGQTQQRLLFGTTIFFYIENSDKWKERVRHFAMYRSHPNFLDLKDSEKSFVSLQESDVQ